MVQNELAALTMVEMKKRDMKVIVTIIIVIMIIIVITTIVVMFIKWKWMLFKEFSGMGCINGNEIARRAKIKFLNLDENYNSSTKADYTFDK